MSLWGTIVVALLTICALGVGIRNCGWESDAPAPRVGADGTIDGQRRVERELRERGEEVRNAARGAMEENCDWASTPVPTDIVGVLDDLLCDDADRERGAALGANTPVRGGESALSD